jgi:hypothetical protein
MRIETKIERYSSSDESSSRSNSISSFEDKKQVKFDKETKNKPISKNDPNSTRAISCPLNNPKPDSAGDRKTKSAIFSNNDAQSNNDLIEWSKMQAKKKSKEKREKELKELLFEDKKLMKKYLDLCEIRDNVPKESPERIEYLKKHDPIFAKRHKLYKTALICNKAPNFDMNDYFFQVKMPKSLITKQRIEIINEANNKTSLNEPKIYKKEMEIADEKVKRFIKEISAL